MQKIVLFVLAWLIVGAAPSGLLAGNREQEASSTAEIMREKLDRAQELLEAVVLRDFAAVEEESGRLHDLSELQSWYVLPTPEYARHSEEFRDAARQAVAAGRNEDAEATLAAYSSMVRKCVQCHEYMERVREVNR